MRLVIPAIALMMIAAVVITAGAYSRLGELIPGLASDPMAPEQTAEAGLKAIPDRVLARLALPSELEPAVGPEVADIGMDRGLLSGGRDGAAPSDPTGASPSIFSTALIGPSGEPSGDPETVEPAGETFTVASLPPQADPLHEEEPAWLSRLSPAAPRPLLIGPQPAAPEAEPRIRQAPPAEQTPDRADLDPGSASAMSDAGRPGQAAGEEGESRGPAEEQMVAALFQMAPLVTGAGPEQQAAPQQHVAPGPRTTPEQRTTQVTASVAATGTAQLAAKPDAAPAGPAPASEADQAERSLAKAPLASSPLPRAAPRDPLAKGAAYVVIGSFRQAKHAEQRAADRPGWRASIRMAEVEGRTWHRVVVGPFSAEDLPQALDRIRSAAVPDAWPLPAPDGQALALSGLDMLG